MSFESMSNEQIVEVIAKNIESKRIHKPISSEELAKKGGHKAQTYSNFINRHTDIRISTLIDIFRGLGELDKLEKAFEHKIPFSPLGIMKKTPKKVYKKSTPTPKPK